MIDNHAATAARRRAQIVGYFALIAGGCGALSTVPFATALQSLLLVVFVLAGVGSAVMCWVDLPPAATVAALVGVSITSVVILATSMAWLNVWYPIPSCLVLSALVAVSGWIRLKTLPLPGTDAH